MVILWYYHRRKKGGILNAAMSLGVVPTALHKSHDIILIALTDCPFRYPPFEVLSYSHRDREKKNPQTGF